MTKNQLQQIVSVLLYDYDEQRGNIQKWESQDQVLGWGEITAVFEDLRLEEKRTGGNQ